jgi:hypothetical protein
MVNPPDLNERIPQRTCGKRYIDPNNKSAELTLSVPVYLPAGGLPTYDRVRAAMQGKYHSDLTKVVVYGYSDVQVSQTTCARTVTVYCSNTITVRAFTEHFYAARVRPDVNASAKNWAAHVFQGHGVGSVHLERVRLIYNHSIMHYVRTLPPSVSLSLFISPSHALCLAQLTLPR